MVSVAGLAPARGGLKIRLLELLCIHGQKVLEGDAKHGVVARWQTLTPRIDVSFLAAQAGLSNAH
jgi:hypothetical protein